MKSPDLLTHFIEQAGWCERLGSPFTAKLLFKAAESLGAKGGVYDLIGDWAGHPVADAVALRLAGALHFAAMTHAHNQLAEQYKAIPSGTYDVDAIWSAAEDYIQRSGETIKAFMQSAPQTNEPQRSLMLLSGHLYLADRFGMATHVRELGASAGLNLGFDQFRVETNHWSWGDPNSPVRLKTDWVGKTPSVEAVLNIASREACDLNPLDVSNEATRLKTRSYVWPDQKERLARFDAAVELAVGTGVTVEKSSADVWLERALQNRPASELTVVHHTVFFQYPPRAAQEKMTMLIEEEGARATPDRPLAWLRFEPEVLWEQSKAGDMVLDVRTWPGDEHVVLAHADAHVRSVRSDFT